MSVDLQRLADQIDAEVDARVRAGKCGCDCGGDLPVPYRGKGRDRHPIPFEQGPKKFVFDSHKQRQYRSKVRHLAEAQDAPVAVSLKSVGLGTATRDRIGDAPGRSRKRQSKPREGLSVYFPDLVTVETVGRALRHARYFEVKPDDPAAQKLDKAIAAVEKAIARRDAAIADRARPTARKAAA